MSNLGGILTLTRRINHPSQANVSDVEPNESESIPKRREAGKLEFEHIFLRPFLHLLLDRLPLPRCYTPSMSPTHCHSAVRVILLPTG